MSRLKVNVVRVLLLASCVVLGCNDPYSQTRIQRRRANIQEFIDDAAVSEGRHPAKMAETFEMFEVMHQDKIVEFERTMREIGYHVW